MRMENREADSADDDLLKEDQLVLDRHIGSVVTSHSRKQLDPVSSSTVCINCHQSNYDECIQRMAQ